MNIGEVVRRIGLSEHTLRYYEKVGLLPPVRRAAGGQRLFSPEDLRLLSFLVKLRATRMPLKQMLRYTALLRQGDVTIGERRLMLEAHQVKVESDIAELQDCLDALRHKLALYRQWEQDGRSAPLLPSTAKPTMGIETCKRVTSAH